MEMPQLSIQISASSVAWYGAIVATLGACVSVFNAWKDRPRIKIKFEPNQYMIGDNALYPENKTYLCINVINQGRRAIKIEQASVRQYGIKGYLILPDSFRDHRIKVIDEKSPRTTFATSQDQFDLSKIYCVIVTDGAGKNYIKYTKRFPTFTRVLYWVKGLSVLKK